MIDETLQDQATLYALGLLSDAEAAEFRAAAGRDPELQAFVDEITESAASLVRALPPTPPPPNSLPRLLARLRAERTTARGAGDCRVGNQLVTLGAGRRLRTRRGAPLVSQF